MPTTQGVQPMPIAICYHSLVAVRAEPSDKAEMVNQLLFGDLALTTEVSGNWIKIKTIHDDYEGWCDYRQIHILSDENYDLILQLDQQLVSDITARLSLQGHPGYTLVLGSTLHLLPDGLMNGPAGKYHLSEGESHTPLLHSPEDLVETAMLYLKTPYLWGGRSPFGIDCSGLIQMIFKLNGISVRRDAAQQALEGQTIHLIEESKTGDIAFFDNAEGRIIHTGILTGNGSIIHASGEVRLDPIDHHGIFNKDEGRYTHNLRIIKRLTNN